MASYLVKRSAAVKGGEIAQTMAMLARPFYFVPVPLYGSRYRERGYNQAEVIAAELAERLSLPLYARFLRRNRYTPPQNALNNHERIRNLCRALEPGPQAKRLLAKQKTPRRVLLVDDIYTTGSTLEACSLVLKTAGVEHIMVATVCIGSGYA
jgi:ComF family protein